MHEAEQSVEGRAQPRMELSLVVSRADGTTEDLGVVAKSHYSLRERTVALLRRQPLGKVTS